jgi:hypothetical protein
MQKNMHRSAHDALAEPGGSLPGLAQQTVEPQEWLAWWYRLAAPLEPQGTLSHDGGEFSLLS